MARRQVDAAALRRGGVPLGGVEVQIAADQLEVVPEVANQQFRSADAALARRIDQAYPVECAARSRGERHQAGHAVHVGAEQRCAGLQASPRVTDVQRRGFSGLLLETDEWLEPR